MNIRHTLHSARTRLLLQLIVNQWLTRRIGGGKSSCSAVALLLSLTLTMLAACSTDPIVPDSNDTRSVVDSTADVGLTIEVDTTWAGVNHYTFDAGDSIDRN